MDRLSQKHRLFVEAYQGDVVTAMQVAGYVGQPAQLKINGEKLLQDPKIIEAIQERSRYLAKTKEIVASREERQAFWTAVMRNEDPHYLPETDEYGTAKPRSNLPMAMRLKAAELLGKSEADFTEKHQIDGNVTVSSIIEQSYLIDDEDIDAIEAEYEAINQKETPEQEEEREEATNESDGVDKEGRSDVHNGTDDDRGPASLI